MWGATNLNGNSAAYCYISIHAPRVGSDLPASFYAQIPAAFQSTLPVWGATAGFCPMSRLQRISIHAPRVGSDTHWMPLPGVETYFNPRSPCGERLALGWYFDMPTEFQSTLPVWGATKTATEITSSAGISIHAPRVGSDMPLAMQIYNHYRFQSTLPVWGATLVRRCAHDPKRYFNPRSPCGERLLTEGA